MKIVVDSPVSLCGESDRVKVEVVAEQVCLFRVVQRCGRWRFRYEAIG